MNFLNKLETFFVKYIYTLGQANLIIFFSSNSNSFRYATTRIHISGFFQCWKLSKRKFLKLFLNGQNWFHVKILEENFINLHTYHVKNFLFLTMFEQKFREFNLSINKAYILDLTKFLRVMWSCSIFRWNWIFTE